VSETNARASSRLAISRIIFDSLRLDGGKFSNIVKIQYMKNLSSRLQSCLVDILFLLSIITLFLDWGGEGGYTPYSQSMQTK